MNLHYSQTDNISEQASEKFDYHMNLHYSQTYIPAKEKMPKFDYHMNLHYSQTVSASIKKDISLTII